MSEPLRLLSIASRPSDFVEMADLSRALAQRGHVVSLAYFYSRDDSTGVGVIQQLRALAAESGVMGAAIEVSAIPSVLPEEAVLAAPVIEVPDDQRVADVARRIVHWVRRHRLNLYPDNTGVAKAYYALAHFIDAARDRERTRQTLRLFRQLRSRLLELPWGLRLQAIRPLHRAAAMVLNYRRSEAFILNSLAQRQFDAMLTPEDIVGNLWPVAIHAGHQRGVPTLVLPYTLANREEAVQSLKDVAYFQSRANQVAAILYPRWRYQNASIDIVRLPSDHILAHEDLGITPPDPWMMNSGAADKILVDSEASLDYFLDGGIPREQLAVVGSVSQDRMFRLRQGRQQHLETLRHELGLSGDKPMLLISGCPNQLTSAVPFCEFQTMEEVVRFVGESLAPLAEHYHLVVRPHPNYLEFGAMMAPYGVVATTRPTSSLVPLCDLFVAFASATIRWAIACAIPTVNYDVFHYGYGDFTNLGGVQSVNGRGEFLDAVRSLTPGSSALKALAVDAKANSARWSLMDGNSLDRIEDEIRAARTRCLNKMKEQQANA
jgi:hypothetical protein